MKKSFTLYCKDRDTGKGEWEFLPHEDGMNVLDPSGRVVCWFAHGDAEGRFDLPSFWRSIKHITFKTAQGKVVQFEPDADDVRRIRSYLDGAILKGGMGRIGGLQKRAWLQAAGGVVIIGGCLAAAILVGQAVQFRDPQRVWYLRPFLAGGVGGIALLGWGLYGVFRFGRLARQWQRENE